MASDERDDPQLPHKLMRALGELYPTPGVPSRVDEAILNRGRARLARSGRSLGDGPVPGHGCRATYT